MSATNQVVLPKLANQESLEEQGLRLLASKRVSADPVPGPLAKAFGASVTLVGDVEVRKPVASDWPMLRQLNSPLLTMLEEIRQNQGKEGFQPDVKYTPDDEAELCWLFTHSPVEARTLFTQGREAFRDKVREDVSDRIDDPMIKLILAVVMQKIGDSWATILKFATKLEEKGEVRFFQEAGAQPSTDSAGGSTQ